MPISNVKHCITTFFEYNGSINRETTMPDDFASCPQCAGTPMLLGVMGTRAHYRCRMCGWDWNETFTDEQEDEHDAE